MIIINYNKIKKNLLSKYKKDKYLCIIFSLFFKATTSLVSLA